MSSRVPIWGIMMAEAIPRRTTTARISARVKPPRRLLPRAVRWRAADAAAAPVRGRTTVFVHITNLRAGAKRSACLASRRSPATRALARLSLTVSDGRTPRAHARLLLRRRGLALVFFGLCDLHLKVTVAEKSHQFIHLAVERLQLVDHLHLTVGRIRDLAVRRRQHRRAAGPLSDKNQALKGNHGHEQLVRLHRGLLFPRRWETRGRERTRNAP